MTEYEHVGYRRPRRGRGWPILLAILVVLGLVVVVGDRIAAAYASRELRAELVSELSSRGVEYGSMDVAIGGFPFLTQVVDGRYDEISIELTDVTVPADDTAALSLGSLLVVASGVDADPSEVMQGTAQITADEVSGTAVLTYRTLETLVDYSRYNLTDVRFTEADGQLKLTGTAALAGFELPISANASVSVTDGRLRIKLRDAKADKTPVPQIAQDYVAGLVERSVAARLPDLPFSLSLDDVAVEEDGLAVSATGRDVPLVT